MNCYAIKRWFGWTGSCWLAALVLCGCDGKPTTPPASAPAAPSASSREAKMILQKADAATQAVKAVSYGINIYGEGEAAKQTLKVNGQVKMEKGDAGKHRLRLEVQTAPSSAAPAQTAPSIPQIQTIFVATDGQTVTRIDPDRKTCTRGNLPDARLLLGTVELLMMTEYLMPGPFKDEVNSQFASYEGVKKVGDADCDVVYVVYGPNKPAARWYFGRKDGLPRRVDRLALGGRGILVYEVTALDADPKFDADTFKPKTPEGFEEKPFQAPDLKPPALLAVGTAAPEWTLAQPDGKTVSLKDLRGKVVVLDFWATWCQPCWQAMPGVQRLHEKFKDKPVAVFGVNAGERGGDPLAFMRQKGYTYGLLLKGDEVARAYHVINLPTFYVIGPDGNILHVAAGFNEQGEANLTGLIEEALKKAE